VSPMLRKLGIEKDKEKILRQVLDYVKLQSCVDPHMETTFHVHNFTFIVKVKDDTAKSSHA
jgi:hypothetical protein